VSSDVKENVTSLASQIREAGSSIPTPTLPQIPTLPTAPPPAAVGGLHRRGKKSNKRWRIQRRTRRRSVKR
jgi:hypothetical protein